MLRSNLFSVAVVAVMLCACGRTDSTAPAPAAAAPKSSSTLVVRPSQVTATRPSHARTAPLAESWPPVEMRDPDPRMRRFALEQWAREPTESLDVVAAALVDPEESIRERAEQIFEDALARRR